MIAPGQKLDLNFRVKVLQDGKPKDVRFGDLLTRRTIVSVYMRNNTPTCDRQNESLGAAVAALDRAGYNVLGISRDTCGSHARYAAARGLSYLLVSDPEHRFARAADALVQKSMYGRSFVGPARAAFILERDGTVLAIVPEVDAARFGQQLQDAIATL